MTRESDLDPIACMMMRGGTSKGLYFLVQDLPADPSARDQLLLHLLGSPDRRQIDGLGGAHPLTSKVAVVGPASDVSGAVDYLFLQVSVDTATVSDAQNCGNILAGVGPFAIERGLVAPAGEETRVQINLLNTGGSATAVVCTPGGVVQYRGDQEIAGVPGTAAPVLLEFEGTAGSACGSLLPTGNPVDDIDGVAATCIDNGMPSVVIAADALGVDGTESPAHLEGREELVARKERIRLLAGELMGLGDVTDKTIPKVCLVSPPRAGGQFGTRSFIPHRVHEAIGVLAGVTAATAWRIPGSSIHDIGEQHDGDIVRLEHPTGFIDVAVRVDPTTREVQRAANVRTARKLMDGVAFG